MSTDRDTTRIVRSWLEEGVTALPDRVLDIVLDQVPATPQRRSWWPTRRIAQLSKFLPAALAAAAVLVVAVVGYNLLPGISGPGGPTAAPTVLPSEPAAATTSAIPVPSSGALQPGRYAWRWSGPTISFEVPGGWSADPNWHRISRNQDSPTEVGWSTWLPDATPITHVYSDACRSEGKLEPVGSTVADLVEALSAQVSTDAVVTDVTVGGLPAKQVEISQSAGIDWATCRHGADSPLQIWADVAETAFYAQAPDGAGVIHIMDIEGARVVFTSSIQTGTSASDIDELNGIIDSIDIGDR